MQFIAGAAALYASASAYLMIKARYHPTMSEASLMRFLRGPYDALKLVGKLPR